MKTYLVTYYDSEVEKVQAENILGVLYVIKGNYLHIWKIVEITIQKP